jgi:hypothetical protein
MYLEIEAIENRINSNQDLFPEQVLYCDLMAKKFFTRFAQSVNSKLVASGGVFSARPDFAEAIFTQHAHHPIDCIPMLKRAGEPGIHWDKAKFFALVSWLLPNVFLKDLSGYAVHPLYFEKI